MQLLKFTILCSLLVVTDFVNAQNTTNLYWQSLKGPNGGMVTSLLPVPLTKSTSQIFAGTAVGIFAAPDFGEHWSVVLPGYKITKLTVAPNKLLYAGTDGAGVFVSMDGGITWNNSKSETPISKATINDLVVAQNGVVYAAAENGVYFSNDCGTTWSRDPTLTSKIRTLASGDDNSIYAFALLTAGKKELYQTVNSGKTWQSLNLQLQEEFYPTTNFVVTADANLYLNGFLGQIYNFNPNNISNPWSTLAFPEESNNSALKVDGNTMYAGFYNGDVFTCTENCKVIASWKELSTINYPIFDFLLDHQYAKAAIYAATLNGVYASWDKGQTWQPPRQPVPNQAVNLLASDAVNIYAGLDSDGVLLASRNNSNNWRLPQKNIAAVAVLFKPIVQDKNIYVPTVNGLYYSNNLGAIWQVNADFHALNALVVNNKGTVFLEDDLKLFMSKDYGKTWQHPLANNINCLSASGDSTYVCRENKAGNIEVVATNDDGQSWRSYGSPEQSLRISKLEFDKNRNIYIGGYSVSSNLSKIYVANSANKNSWKLLCQTRIDEIIHQLITERDNVYAVTGNANAIGATNIYLYNNAQCKVVYAAPAGEILGKIVIDPVTGYLYKFKATNAQGLVQGLSISGDHGASWAAIPQFGAQQVNDVVINSNDGTIYVATFTQGVFVSTDHGISWQAENSGLNPLAVESLMLDAKNNLFATTFGGGMYKAIKN